MGPQSARIAALLAEVADDLASCRSPAAFLSALRSNDRAWREVAQSRHEIGWAVPREVEAFALSILGRARRGLSDHDVEELIAHNRAIAAVLGEAMETAIPASRGGRGLAAGAC